MATLMWVYDLLRRFADGRAVVYQPSLALATADGSSNDEAAGIRLGMRVHNHYIRSQTTSCLAQTMDLLPSNGR
jgi:hypothetical protein